MKVLLNLLRALRLSLAAEIRDIDNDDQTAVIQNWMRNRNTIEFLGVWEELHNPDFNRVQFEAVKNEAGTNAFTMSPKNLKTV